MTRSGGLALSSATASALIAIRQLAPLVILETEEYGYYSIVFLVFILGSSVLSAFVTDSWNRSRHRTNRSASWQEFSASVVLVSLITAAATVIVSVPFPQLHIALAFSAVAVAATTLRGGARYFLIQTKNFRRVFHGDIAALLTTVLGYPTIYLLGLTTVDAVVAVWGLGSLVSLIWMDRPSLPSFARAKAWLKVHRQDIRALARDSILQDLGTVWAPSVVGLGLDVYSLALYRGISNVAAPVRLAITPLRPHIASRPFRGQVTARRIALLVLIAAAFSSFAYVGLIIIHVFSLPLGVLSDLTPYAMPASLFVAGNLLTHYYSAVARAHATSTTLLFGRLIQAAALSVLPVGAAFTLGLPAALWALGVGCLGSAIVWIALLHRACHSIDADGPAVEAEQITGSDD